MAFAHAGLIAAPLAGAPIDSAAVIAGPSGTITRSGLAAAPLAAPAIAAYSAAAPLAYAAPALAAPAYAAPAIAAAPLARILAPAGSGLEGQWIPDINEKLYDDGSYKPHIYGF